MSKEHAQNTMGQLITSEAERDAIHIALAPVKAGTRLTPGQHVGLSKGEALPRDARTLANKVKHIGIVDPFLQQDVQAGEWFWLFLYPNTITGLSHRWEHPSFPEQELRQESDKYIIRAYSEEWMTRFAQNLSCTKDEMLAGAKQYLETGDYFVRGGNFEGESVPDEFWDHYKALTGTEVKDEDRINFFSCSC